MLQESKHFYSFIEKDKLFKNEFKIVSFAKVLKCIYYYNGQKYFDHLSCIKSK